VAFARTFVLTAAIASAVFAQPKLSIEHLALQQIEDGPALAASYEFVPGESAHFSCRVAGFRTTAKDEAQLVKLAWNIHVIDPGGVPIQKDKSGRIEETLTARDKNWVPKFLETFTVPSFAPSGVYHVRVTVSDEIAAAEASGELEFNVRGHPVEPSASLTVRNFKFVRAEDDQVPMRPAVYHPGETLWAKFDINGYKFAENHRFSVDYGLAILDAAGEQIFAQPAAASESRESFYPQLYVPGALSLNLDANVVRAAYTLVIIVHDKIGNQSQESKQPFEVQ
jgi:hypothetical protein